MTDYYKKFQPTKPELTISFPNVEAAELFKVWLSEHGEQDYWEWCVNSEDEDSPKVVNSFDYHQDPNKIIGLN